MKGKLKKTRKKRRKNKNWKDNRKIIRFFPKNILKFVNLLIFKIKSRVQNSNAIVDNRKALKEKKEILSNQIQEKLKNDNDRFVLWKKEMNEKISQRPLLVETGSDFD